MGHHGSINVTRRLFKRNLTLAEETCDRGTNFVTKVSIDDAGNDFVGATVRVMGTGFTINIVILLLH